MRGSQLFESLPDHGGEREASIVEAVRSGHYAPIFWQPVEQVVRGKSITYYVSADVLRLGDAEDSFRVNCTARSAQYLADALGCYLPTTKICDDLYRMVSSRNIDLAPCLQPPDPAKRQARYQGRSPRMDDKQAMLIHHECVQAQLRKRVPPTQPRIACNAGKDWVLTNVLLTKKASTAANYGWFSGLAPYRTTSGLSAWQQLGFRHNLDHVDYSQTLRLVHDVVLVDGTETSFAEIARHDQLSAAISDEGPLRLLSLLDRPADTEPVPPSFEPEEPPTEAMHSPLADKYREAKHYTRVDRSQDIALVVLHTAEIVEKPTAAEALMNWCAGPNAPRASWHFAVDDDSTTQSVLERFIAWHAPGANRTGIGIEMCGRARQSLDQWHDEYSLAVLERTAHLTRHLCDKWGLPVRFVDQEGLRRGDKGITTHAAVTRAFRKSTHTDPGKHFPMDEFLAMVRS
jgi:hypothetical protein